MNTDKYSITTNKRIKFTQEINYLWINKFASRHQRKEIPRIIKQLGSNFLLNYEVPDYNLILVRYLH